jgi:hypothetical protein
MIKRLFLFVMLALNCFILANCQGEQQQPAVAATAAPTPTADPLDQTKVWEKWQKSPHAQTYDIHKGPNTYCSRCHSPRNWDPQAVIDPPPNCVSCKFQFEEEPRIAAGNPLVTREEWTDIRCDICHQMQEGLADPTLVWWDQAAGEYITMINATAQCEQCHTNTETIQHQRDLGQEAHVDFLCTDCHDAHSVAAGCATAECHAGLSLEHHESPPETTAAADNQAVADHTSLSCVACHDSAGLEVGPLEDGTWTTWRTIELMGRSSTRPYQSHNVRLHVDCRRCHFAGNSWNLNEVNQ